VSIKKTVVTICLCFVVLAGATIFFLASPRMAMTTEDVILDKISREMPFIEMRVDEIEMLNSLRIAPDIEIASSMGTLIEWHDEDAHILVGDTISEYDELSVSVIYGDIHVTYTTGNYRFVLSLFLDDDIMKTISVFGSMGEIVSMYDNYNNETYQRTQRRLVFGEPT